MNTNFFKSDPHCSIASYVIISDTDLATILVDSVEVHQPKKTLEFPGKGRLARSIGSGKGVLHIIPSSFESESDHHIISKGVA